MEIADLRDWIIVIYGILGIVVLLIFAIMLFLIYRKISSILNSAKEVTDTVRDTVVDPLRKIQGFISGISKGIDIICSIGKRR